MTIPHSNAGEERIFSLISKNKTPSRSSLQLDGSLSSLIVVKTHINNPLQWTPPLEMLQRAKTATKTYNEQHNTDFQYFIIFFPWLLLTNSSSVYIAGQL